MTRAEVARKFDEIIDFAGVEQFIDTPVKRYSSGMGLRLGFAVAAHLEPEILVVDEVLAVGDAEFQKKCLGKMGEVAGQGRTVLFVSHNMSAMKSLCTRGILLNQGKIIFSGSPESVISSYLTDTRNSATYNASPTTPVDAQQSAYISAIRLKTETGEIVSQLTTSDSFYLEINYQVFHSGTILNLSIAVYTAEDTYVLSSPSLTDRKWSLKPHDVGVYTSRCDFPGNFFNKGHYSLTILLVQEGRYIVQQLDRVISIEFIDDESLLGGYFGYWGGIVRPILNWITVKAQ